MLCCGRSRAKCLAAVITMATVGPAIAAPYAPADAVNSTDGGPKPLIVPAAHRGQDRNFDGYAKAPSAEAPAEYYEVTPGGVASDRANQFTPVIRGQSEGLNAAEWTPPPTEQPRQLTPSALGHWVAVVGAVAKPGCHELPARSISVAELMERCGGLTSAATGTLAVVRDGRALGLAYNPQDRLLSGDVIVVAEKPSSSLSVAPVALKETSEFHQPEAGVQLGLVNVLDRPVPVRVRSSHATVAHMLALAPQLRPDQIKVIRGGTEEMFGDQVTELTPGTVLVFPPGSVDRETLGEVETRFYPVTTQGTMSEPAPMSTEPALQSLGTPPSMLNASNGELPGGASAQPLPAEFASSAPAADLTTLPRVEMLEAPDDDSLRFPRTADASGAMPIGAPEAGSHIVPFPSDAVGADVSPPAAASATPPPVTLSEDAESTNTSNGLPTLAELAPTLLIGTILGAATFFALRLWRKRSAAESIIARLSTLHRFIRQPKIVRGAEIKSASPDDMLAALIANRLALREEAVVLAPALRLYGRSSAMKHRRIDPPSAEIARPHIPVTTTFDDESVKAVSSIEENVDDATRSGMRVRFDDAEEMTRAKKTDKGGTPFERALAAMRAGQK